MPVFYRREPPFRRQRELQFDWDSFGGGLNTLFRDTEIKNNEVSQFQNLMLVGQGVPTKRWGTDLYFTSSATGSVRGLGGFYQVDGTNQLLAITDEG